MSFLQHKFPRTGALSGIHTIAMDLDGTLLDSRASISSLNHYVLQSALDSGLRLILATGRRFSSAFPYACEFKGDIAVIANNGQVTRRSPSGERVSEVYLSTRGARAALALGKSKGFSPLLHVDRFEEGVDILIEAPITSPVFHNYSGGDTERTRVVANCVEHGEDRVLVVCFLSQNREELSDLEKNLLRLPEASEYRTVLTKVPGVAFCLEVLEKGASKWAAIRSFLQASGLDTKGVISFGDESNDTEMIAHSGFGFAMKNAVPGLKEKANFVTRYSNNEDGIAMTLLELAALRFP